MIPKESYPMRPSPWHRWLQEPADAAGLCMKMSRRPSLSKSRRKSCSAAASSTPAVAPPGNWE